MAVLDGWHICEVEGEKTHVPCLHKNKKWWFNGKEVKIKSHIHAMNLKHVKEVPVDLTADKEIVYGLLNELAAEIPSIRTSLDKLRRRTLTVRKELSADFIDTFDELWYDIFGDEITNATIGDMACFGLPTLRRFRTAVKRS
jgi:hypothetical protein